MILHQLIARHFFIVIYLLTKLYHFTQWVLTLDKFVITDIARSFEYCVTVLRIGIG